MTEIMSMEWNTFYYWHRRALEIFSAKCQRQLKEIAEVENVDSGKVDDDTFEKQRKALYAKIEAYENSIQGTISG